MGEGDGVGLNSVCVRERESERDVQVIQEIKVGTTREG